MCVRYSRFWFMQRSKNPECLFLFGESLFDHCRCFAVALGQTGEPRVANRGAVPSHVDGVHHRQGAPHSETETE
jgi:hypothetical protein